MNTTCLPDLVAARQIAAQFNVDTQTVLKWARSDRIPSVRVSSRCVRFDPVAVRQALMESKEAK